MVIVTVQTDVFLVLASKSSDHWVIPILFGEISSLLYSFLVFLYSSLTKQKLDTFDMVAKLIFSLLSSSYNLSHKIYCRERPCTKVIVTISLRERYTLSSFIKKNWFW